MTKWGFPGVAVLAVSAAACAANPRPASLSTLGAADTRTIVHLLNRITFGAREQDVARVRALGLRAYLEEQLHPEQLPDEPVNAYLATLPALKISALTFATSYYKPMASARQEFTNTQKGTPKPVSLRGHLLPIAATTLPGGDRPVALVRQPAVTMEEAVFYRQNQEVFDELTAQKVYRAAFSERQLQEVLTDFWFNHFNVDASKIEDRPVVAEYERDAIRPHVLGRFRDLLEATSKSPAMLFYLDNWLSRAAPAVKKGTPPRPAAGTGLNENYARELMELHTLGVNGGYTQRDVVEVARAFTGWTLRDPHDGSGFTFNERVHDHGAKHVLGHTLKAGRGIEDGEDVLDLLARHRSTARFIATKLVRRFVSDTPPPALVDRAAQAFTRTDGDLREVMRVILTSPEFNAPAVYRAKVKSPFEFVVSAIRASGVTIRNARPIVAAIAGMGEPLYQCQPPTGYGDRADVWVNSGALVSRLNFAQALAANGLNGGTTGLAGQGADGPNRITAALADDLSEATRSVAQSPTASTAIRAALLIGSPEFQRR
jgi:uncharacterized protein (DUF1800 family)